MTARNVFVFAMLLSAGAVACGDDEAPAAHPSDERPAAPETQDEEPPSDDGVLVEQTAPDKGAQEPGAKKTLADCEGYTEILGPATNTVRRAYSDKVKAACQAIVKMCEAGAPDSRKILCSALAYDGVYYGNGYSTTYGGAKAIPIYGFSASSANYGLQPIDWLEDRTPGLSANNLLECSGLTAVALSKAYGFESPNLYCSGQFTEKQNPTLFDQLTVAQIRPGDFLTKTFGCNSTTSGHVAIAASAVDTATNTVIVYETNAWKKPVRFTERPLSYFAGGWSRFVPPKSTIK